MVLPLAPDLNVLGVAAEAAPESRPLTSPDFGVKPRVLIAHPGRQHSHQAALALHQAGYLACYATGVPVSPSQFGRFGQSLLRRFSVYDRIDVPVELTKLNMRA